MELTSELILCKVYKDILNESLLLSMFGGAEGVAVHACMGRKTSKFDIVNIPTSDDDDSAVKLLEIKATILGSRQVSFIPVTSIFIKDDKLWFKGRISLVIAETGEVLGNSRDSNYITMTALSLNQRDFLLAINNDIRANGLEIESELAIVTSLQTTHNNVVIFSSASFQYKVTSVIKILDEIVTAIKSSPNLDNSLLATCIDSSKTSLTKGKEYPIISLLDDLVGVKTDESNDAKFFKINRFKLA